MSYIPKSKHQQHITPDRVWEIISEIVNTPVNICREMFYDPCPPNVPYKSPCFHNGLYGDWEQFNYVNPPYEKNTLEKFVIKAVEQSKKGNWSIMLCPVKTDQDWFHDYILKNCYKIVYIRGRLKFKNNKYSAPNVHFLVIVR